MKAKPANTAASHRFLPLEIFARETSAFWSQQFHTEALSHC